MCLAHTAKTLVPFRTPHARDGTLTICRHPGRLLWGQEGPNQDVRRSQRGREATSHQTRRRHLRIHIRYLLPYRRTAVPTSP